ncbi:hypothetical protein CG717_07295 [Streptomyces sp. CB02613]|uniref:transposase n=1 Tax=Streptomyces sp. CB02613 TaxID=2020328 RepID=UPI000C27266C|nr:transposase [Streptomyces sp. CB02613]PJN34369.1 hypothetical protein CG717_07295 [Streptomyces sp. CB02613]
MLAEETSYPRVRVESGGRGVSQAGAVLLVETVRKSGLDQAISTALAPWRKPRAVHDPGKVLLDLAVAPGGEIQHGAWVAEITGDSLKGWPKGMRLIVRKERPRPGAQLRITDANGLRQTCFATNTTDMPIAALELRHRQRARAEDRIRAARATGLRNLPLHDTAQNQIWLEIVQVALDLLAWMPMLALTGETRSWEPRRLRLRLFSAAAQLVTTARRRHLRFARHWPWTDVITDALSRLEALPNPG